jgi:hypothetical protein
VFNALANQTEHGLFRKAGALELSRTIVKLFVHPNLWVANGAVGIIAASAKSIGPVGTQVLLYRIFRHYRSATSTSSQKNNSSTTDKSRFVLQTLANLASAVGVRYRNNIGRQNRRITLQETLQRTAEFRCHHRPVRPGRNMPPNNRRSSFSRSSLDKSNRSEE